MTRDVATQISEQFEQLGWNHTVTFGPSDGFTVLLQVSQLSGPQLATLFGVLSPGGVPVDATVSLSTNGLVVS